MNAYGAYLRLLSKQTRLAESETASIAGEVLSNIRTVKSYVAEEHELDRFNSANRRSTMLYALFGMHLGLFQGITNTTIGLLSLFILNYGGKMVVNGDIGAGALMTYLLATQSAQKCLASLGVLFGQVMKASGSAARFLEYMDADIPCSYESSRLTPLRGEIEFQNVTFSVLDHLLVYNLSV
jgi:ATP-binding cassette subfamily B (MDR/TAP) protein 8